MSEQNSQPLGPDGKPDPTVLVQAAIDRLERAMKEFFGERFSGLEALMNEKFSGVNSRQQDAVEHRRVQLDNLAQRIDQAERLRVELKADNEKNIEKALMGVEKANEKLETSITRTLSQMSETAKSDNEGLRRDIDAVKDRITDNKERVVGIEQQKVGAKDDRTMLYAGLGAILVLINLALAIGLIVK